MADPFESDELRRMSSGPVPWSREPDPFVRSSAADRNGVTVNQRANGDIVLVWADGSSATMEKGSDGAYMWSAFLRAPAVWPEEGDGGIVADETK